MTLADSFLTHPIVWASSLIEFAGAIGIFAILGGVITGVFRQYRLHECHIKGCRRLQWRIVPGTTYVVCKHHHPHEEPTHERVLEEHRAASTSG